MPPKSRRRKRGADPIKEATRRLKKNPQDVVALLRRAEAYLARRDAASALQDVEMALQTVMLEPKKLDEQAREGVLTKLYIVQSRALLRLGDHSAALEAIERALKEQPDDLAALTQRARVRRESGNLDGACQDFTRVIELDNSSTLAYVGRGMARREMDDYEGALADYDRAIELNETLSLVWSNRGRIHLELHNLSEAARDCRTAIRLDPRLVGAYATLALVMRHRGMPEEAIRVLTTGLAQHPDHPSLLVELARAYSDQNQFSEARDILDTMLQHAPDDDEALALRGQIHGRNGDIPAALQDLGRAVELGSTNPETYFNYALAHWHAGNRLEALVAASRVLQLTPDNNEARTWRTKLARSLELEALDQVARTMEEFAYSLCGPGLKWKVELRQMHQLKSDGTPESFNAAVLDLCQTPQALLQIRATPTEYQLTILAEMSVPQIQQTYFAEVLNETIPAQPAQLLRLLNHFVTQRILIQEKNQLRYGTKDG